MAREEVLLDLIERVYAAAEEPRLWSESLERLSQAVGGRLAALASEDLGVSRASRTPSLRHGRNIFHIPVLALFVSATFVLSSPAALAERAAKTVPPPSIQDLPDIPGEANLRSSLGETVDYVFPVDIQQGERTARAFETPVLSWGEPVNYRSFAGVNYTLKAFQGRYVAVLLPDSWLGADKLTPDLVRVFVDRADLLYRSRSPARVSPTRALCA